MKGVLNTLSRWIRPGAEDGPAAPRATAPGPPAPAEDDGAGEADQAVHYRVEACLMTDVGCYREVNEDTVRYIRPADPDVRAAKGSLLIVADGMGGHEAGEVASRMAVDVIARAYYASEEPAPAALEQAFHEANRAIYEAARHGAHTGMGTTGTALALCGNAALCAHVGDSRLYLVRNNDIFRMSEDHSLVMEMVRTGLLTQDEARFHDDKNIILRALGTKPDVDVTTWPEPLRVGPGDRFLLCSDGLYDLVADDEMLLALQDATPHAACEALIVLAKERGGHDNISIGLIALVAADEAAPPTGRPTRDAQALPDDDALRPTRESRAFEE